MALPLPLPLGLRALTVGYRTVLEVEGEIDIATAQQLEEVVAGHVAAGGGELWVDLSRVEFMDSNGLHLLLRAQSDLVRQRRRLAVICPPGPVRRLFAVAGADARLPVFADRTSAHFAH
jgi:anti-sigma B factor antagonist